MARYSSRAPRGYISREQVRVPGASLINASAGTISNAGIMAIRPQNVRPGQTKASMVFAPRLSEGDSAGYNAIANSLDNAAATISQRYIKWLDTKAALEASDAQAVFQQRASEIWLGKPIQELQPDGSVKEAYQPGFAHTEARAAVDGYNAYESAIRAAWKETGEHLGDSAKKKYFTNSLYAMTNALNQGRQHAAMAMKQWDKQVLNQDIQAIQKGVGNLLTAGDVKGVRPYLGDQLEQLIVKHPVLDPSKVESLKQGILKDTAAYLSTQQSASVKIKTFKQLMGNDADLETKAFIDSRYMRAVKFEQAERDRQEVRSERIRAKRIRANDKQVIARILDPTDKWLPTVPQARQMLEKDQISIGTYKFIAARHKSSDGGAELNPAQMYAMKQRILMGAQLDSLPVNPGSLKRSQANEIYNYTLSIQNQRIKSDLALGHKNLESTIKLFENTKGKSVPAPVVAQRYDQLYLDAVQNAKSPNQINIQAITDQALFDNGLDSKELEGAYTPIAVALPMVKDPKVSVKEVLGSDGYALSPPGASGRTRIVFKNAEALVVTWKHYRDLAKKHAMGQQEFLRFNNEMIRWYNYFLQRNEWPYAPLKDTQNTMNSPLDTKVRRSPTAQERLRSESLKQMKDEMTR